MTSLDAFITCPVCGNNKDRTILINASCTAVVEGDQFDYIDCDATDDQVATCQRCGHASPLRAFKQGCAPLSQNEFACLESELVLIAEQHRGFRGARTAWRCIALLKQQLQVAIPTQVGEQQ